MQTGRVVHRSAGRSWQAVRRHAPDKVQRIKSEEDLIGSQAGRLSGAPYRSIPNCMSARPLWRAQHRALRQCFRESRIRTREKDGEIVDVKISYPADYVK